MKLERVSSPIANPLLEQYWGNESWVQSFFPYTVEQHSFSERLSWLDGQAYDRQQLAQVIESYMTPYTLSAKAKMHLKALADDAVVIVGGQQAGLLTGPLFSIYKAITVILLAKQQTEVLGRSVVPIFWVAGEDHDIDEINHTYTVHNDSAKKQIFADANKVKKMASETAFDREGLQQFVRTVFKEYGEGTYTAELLNRVLSAVDATNTYTEYFTALMHELFEHEGLLFIDAAYKPFRQYESKMFEKIIVANEKIASSVVEQESAFVALGFDAPIQATVENANLFYVENGERLLLERKDGYFVHAVKGIRFSEEELLQIAKDTPEKLSNNVVTRPLMQEMTLPVLTFVGGPGELAYWATLKDAFESLQLQMPIFVPRLSVTLVSRQVQYAMKQTKVKLAQVFDKQVPVLKRQFIESQKSEALIASIAAMEQQLQAQYEQLATQLAANEIELTTTLKRNESYHQQQFEYLKRKLHERYEVKHDITLQQMNTIQAQLLPNDKPQERLYSAYQFMNDYGMSFVSDLMREVNPIEKKHVIVQL